MRSRRSAAAVRRLGDNRVGFVPGTLVDDRGVLAGVRYALVDRLAEVDAVGEHLIDGALAPRPAAAGTGGAGPPLRDLACSVQLSRDGECRAGLGEAYVPFFSAFRTAWNNSMFVRWSANPLGMLWPEIDAALIASNGGSVPPATPRRQVVIAGS